MMVLEALVAPAVEAGVNAGGAAAISFIDKCSYWSNIKRHYKELMQEATKLWDLRDGIEDKISKYRRSQDTRRWMAEVVIKRMEVTRLEEEYQDCRNNHKWGSRRIEISKNMALECGKVRTLWEAGIRIREEFDAEQPDPVMRIPAPTIEDNSSRNKAVEDLVTSLEDAEISRIGIWGAVGVGKTAIMKNLNNHEKIAKMFSIVIWVAVKGKSSTVESLQHEIMRRLKVPEAGISSTERENALTISAELRENKCLILLDGVCRYMDLVEMIGIDDKQKNCKVVLASRDKLLCKRMGVDAIISVMPLPSSEAFHMFKGIVGKDIISSPRVKQMAELVLRECGGLPLLIDMVAKAFRSMSGDSERWIRGRERLRNWMNMEGMEEVLEALKFCYHECLGNDAKRITCFLYSVFYPEECEIYIRYLLECWRVEGLVLDDGNSLLEHLLSFSLLESSGNKKSVKMNKVLREMALKLLSQTEEYPKILARPREGLHEPPNPEEWKQVSRISLMDNKLRSLPETPECSNLLTLFLQKNENLISIPECFFALMGNLRVLDLHGTGIKSLPPSLCSLIHLKGLYLNSCTHLVQLPIDIDRLKQLEVLDIRGTRLSLFQIKVLTWLKFLRVSMSNFDTGSQTDEDQIAGSVSCFVFLEEFSVDIDSSSQWWWEGIGNAIAEEVAILKNLTSLQFCFATMQCLELFVSSNPAWKAYFGRTEPVWEDFSFAFRFAVGSDHSITSFHILESFDDPDYNCLKFINCEGKNPVVSEVLAKTQAFGLINHKGVSRLSDFSTEGHMNNLIICSIEGCDEIQTIIDGTGITEGVLECLQHLQVKNVVNLESIWQGPIHAGSLNHLKTLILVQCPNLKKIFSAGLIQQLSELEDLRVEKCDQIEVIISKLNNDGLESDQLPRLKTLTLLNLPKLRLISVNDSWQWRSLQRIEISSCHMLKSLPFNYSNATKLRQIKGRQIWWDALEWKDDGVKRRWESVCILN